MDDMFTPPFKKKVFGPRAPFLYKIKKKHKKKLKILKNLVLGVFSGGSGVCYIQKIHRGIDPDDISNFQKFDFQKSSFSLFF